MDELPPPAPRMKIVSIRVSEDMWDAIQDESLRAGISASQFMREATLIRLAYRWGQRDSDAELLARLRELGLIEEPP